VVLLWRGSRKMGIATAVDDRLRRRIGRIALACVGLGITLWLGEIVLRPMFAVSRPAALALLILSATLVYFILSHVMNAFRLSELRRAAGRG